MRTAAGGSPYVGGATVASTKHNMQAIRRGVTPHVGSKTDTGKVSVSRQRTWEIVTIPFTFGLHKASTRNAQGHNSGKNVGIS